MSKRILIIGAGQAAVAFINRYRTHDPVSEIILIGEEAVLPYQRPPLSKKYATGEMDADRLLLRPEEWYQEMAVRFVSGNPVIHLDVDTKTVTLQDGAIEKWDQLLLATGSRARNLPAEVGGDLEGVFVLRSLHDADLLKSSLSTARNAVVIGGGYIGLEAAAVAASLGIEVTVIEAADRILKRVACAETSTYFRSLHESHGVQIVEGSSLRALEGANGRFTHAVLDNGEAIAADFALVGIGIIPNQELAEEAGINSDNGILVDRHCRTSHPDVFAAGDCARFNFGDQLTRLESVQNAIDQADCAADNMAGISRRYDPVPWFWSDQYDTKLQIAGLNRNYDEVVIRAGEREGAVTHWYFSQGKFIAVDAMNDPRAYMVGKKLLESDKQVEPNQIANSETDLKTLL